MNQPVHIVTPAETAQARLNSLSPAAAGIIAALTQSLEQYGQGTYFAPLAMGTQCLDEAALVLADQGWKTLTGTRDPQFNSSYTRHILAGMRTLTVWL
jgi:hypothetical protein